MSTPFDPYKTYKTKNQTKQTISIVFNTVINRGKRNLLRTFFYFNDFYTSTGIRNEIPDVGHCGQKFICDTQGGSLELHGKDKLSWTKLDKTLNPLKVGDGIVYQHQVSVYNKFKGTIVKSKDYRKQV